MSLFSFDELCPICGQLIGLDGVCKDCKHLGSVDKLGHTGVNIWDSKSKK